MTDRLPQVTPLELTRALERLGFMIRRQTGSHSILRHPETRRMVAIPLHAREIKRGLLFGILKQAGVTKEQIRQAL